MSNTGTKIIEQGSTAGGIAKVQYLDEGGNVLYEVNDSDKIFKMVNGKISGLAGTGNRMVVADLAGNLSVGETINNSISSTMSNATKTKNLTLTNSNLAGETSLIFRQDVANDLAEISQIRNGYDGRLRLKTSDTSGVMNTCIEVKGSDKTVTLSSLAGTGNRIVIADSNGNLSASDRFKVNTIPTINTSAGINPIYMDNYDITFQWMNNTTLKIAMKGTDGVLRSVNLTLS